MASYYCSKCNKTMEEKEFYRSNNLEKYPNNGIIPICKKCFTMHIDNWDTSTFLPLLEEVDVPWVPEEWNKLMLKYASDPKKLTGVTIFGRYLSKMRLKQWKEFRYKDTEFLQKMANSKLEQVMKEQGCEAAEIAEAIDRSTKITNQVQLPIEAKAPKKSEKGTDEALPPSQIPQGPNFNDPDYFDQMNGISQDDLMVDLTPEEKLRLRIKWGKTYRPEEWVQLETMYNEMMESYDIQTAGHIDTLKLICKTSLKANQLIDIGDVESYQKMSKVYDALMKAGKFTAAQVKEDSDSAVDSIGEIVALCEKDGFIARYYTDGPQDKVDKTILDLEKYTHDLVTEELSLGNLIENAINKLQEERESIQISNNTPVDFEEKLFSYDEEPEITTQEIMDFNEFNEQLREQDIQDADGDNK